MTEVTTEEYEVTVAVPLLAIALSFEPWDELDSALWKLQDAKGTDPALAELIATAVAARDKLRGPLYAIMRAYQAAGGDDIYEAALEAQAKAGA